MPASIHAFPAYQSGGEPETLLQLQAFFLVADDMMDSSHTRRGVPCWFRLPGVSCFSHADSVLGPSRSVADGRIISSKDGCKHSLHSLCVVLSRLSQDVCAKHRMNVTLK